MTNIHPEMIVTCFKHLAFCWFQQFSMSKFTKLEIVTSEQLRKAVLCDLRNSLAQSCTGTRKPHFQRRKLM